MIFCESFISAKDKPRDPSFDRRDVYLITQNALADGTYLNYIRAQYNRSTQIDPPFFQDLFRSEKERLDNATTNALARLVQPLDRFFTGLGDQVEKRRRTYTSWFTDADFLDLPAFAARLRPGPQQDAVSKFIYEGLSTETRTLLTATGNDQRLRRALARGLNLLLERELGVNQPPLYTPERFRHVEISEYLRDFIAQDPRSHTRIRLNRLLLESAYPTLIAPSLGGVYPDREIYAPTPQDSGRCYNDYLADASRRYQHDLQFPNEPKQIKPGEDLRYDPATEKLAVAGQVAVMTINGFITKVIFDHNPRNEFFVEESLPLDWMYPYLTPFGIIMKINRQPLPELTEDVVQRDHAFWTQYSERLIGNWITYDTPVKDIAAWVEKTYLRRDFKGFSGDRKFIRDDQAQKSFSKLRSSIAGVYAWRVATAKPGSPDQQRMLKEADFAFRQSLAFCPYSPEAVFRYVTLLLGQQRFDEARLIAHTCLKLDPYNAGILDLVNRLDAFKKQQAQLNPSQLELRLRENPQDFQAAFNLASAYLQAGQTANAVGALDHVLTNSAADANALRALLEAFSSIGSGQKIQQVVDRLSAQVRSNSANLGAATALAEGYRYLQKNELALQVLDTVVNDPRLDASAALQAAQQYAALGNYPRLEVTLEKFVKLAPDSPEAWYDLAAMKTILGKTNEALPALRQALALSAARLQNDPKAKDLATEVKTDPRFVGLRQHPDFKALLNLK